MNDGLKGMTMKSKVVSKNLPAAIATTSAAVATVTNLVGLALLLNRKPESNHAFTDKNHSVQKGIDNMINFFDDKYVYLRCPRCKRAYEAWKAENWASDDYYDTLADVDDPVELVYKTETDVTCPLCGYRDYVSGVHTPSKFILSARGRKIEMSLDEVLEPPEYRKPKRSFLGAGNGGSAALSSGALLFRNIKPGVNGMRKASSSRKGSRRWS